MGPSQCLMAGHARRRAEAGGRGMRSLRKRRSQDPRVYRHCVPEAEDAMTPEQRARLVEVMARANYESHRFVKHWHHRDTIQRWHHVCKEEARAAIAAAERAGFRIEGPADG